MTTETKTQTLRLEYVSPEALKPASYNPDSRTEAAALRELEASILDVGIIQPIRVTDDYQVIDGHRRWTIARRHKFESVPVIVGNNSGFGLDRLYGDANRATRKIGGADWLQVYVNGGQPPERWAARCAELESIVGKTRVKELAHDRKALHVLSVAKYVARYCDDDSKAFLRALILWMLKHRMQLLAKRAVVHAVPQDVIIAAVKEDRPLRWTMALG